MDGITKNTTALLAAIIIISVLMIILFIIVIYSIIKTQTNTRILTEQNEQLIAQNNLLIDEIRQIKQQQYSSAENEFKYMQFMTHKQQQ